MVMVEGGKDVSWRRLVVLWGGRSTTLPIELELEFNSMGKALVWRRSWGACKTFTAPTVLSSVGVIARCLARADKLPVRVFPG